MARRLSLKGIGKRKAARKKTPGRGSGWEKRWARRHTTTTTTTTTTTSTTTTTTSPYGPELHVTPNVASDPYGNESSSTNSWYDAGGALKGPNPVNPYAGSWTLNCNNISSSGDTIYKVIASEFSLESGKTYRVSFVYRSVSAAEIEVGFSTNISGITESIGITTSQTWVSVEYDFYYDGLKNYFVVQSTGGTTTAALDNFSFREIL
jgi:hypothetical protein